MKNESKLDRAIRVVLGVALLYCLWFCVHAHVYASAQIWYAWAGIVVALYLLVTGLTGFCPIYKMLNIGSKWATRENGTAAGNNGTATK